MQMFPSFGNICCGKKKFAARKQENVFASGQKHFCLPDTDFASETVFPSFASTNAMFTSFQCCSLKMFPRNGEHTTMADGEAKVEKPNAGHKKGRG